MKQVFGFAQTAATTAATTTTTPISTLSTTTSDTLSYPPVTTSPSSFPAIPCCTPEFFNTLIKASHDWRLYDVRRIVNELSMGHLQVRSNGESLTIDKLLNRLHQYGFATMVRVGWRGGPSCRSNLQSNLAHWLLDNIMWEVRLKSRYTNGEGRKLTQKILSII